LNDIDALSDLSLRHETPILLDAVSSFGAEELRFREWNIEACAGVANKCLHGAPGLSFVIAKDEALNLAGHASSIYLDLRGHDLAQESGTCRFTLPTHICAALLQAIAELKGQGGPAARRKTYLDRLAALEDSIALAGHLALIPEPVYRSSVLHAYRMGNGESYSKLHDRLKAHGFVVYAGQGGNNQDVFRISLMGEIPWSEISRLAAAFAS
jgi:2-aminoethylphosphonate-pyruvate transaminase